MPNYVTTEYGSYPLLDISMLPEGKCIIVCDNEAELRHLLHSMKAQYPEICDNWDSDVFDYIGFSAYPQIIYRTDWDGLVYRANVNESVGKTSWRFIPFSDLDLLDDDWAKIELNSDNLLEFLQ